MGANGRHSSVTDEVALEDHMLARRTDADGNPRSAADRLSHLEQHEWIADQRISRVATKAQEVFDAVRAMMRSRAEEKDAMQKMHASAITHFDKCVSEVKRAARLGGWRGRDWALVIAAVAALAGAIMAHFPATQFSSPAPIVAPTHTEETHVR